MSLEAVDLIDKLLTINPLKRFGYGPEEEELDFTALKNHNFFKDVNFSKIASGSTAPPIPPDLKKLCEDSQYNPSNTDDDP